MLQMPRAWSSAQRTLCTIEERRPEERYAEQAQPGGDRAAGKPKCDPIQDMAKSAQDWIAPLEIRAHALRCCWGWQCVAPKRNAIKHTGGNSVVPARFVIFG